MSTIPPLSVRVWFGDRIHQALFLGLFVMAEFGAGLLTAPSSTPTGVLWFLWAAFAYGSGYTLVCLAAMFMRWRNIYRPNWLMCDADRDTEHAASVAAWEAEHGLTWHDSMRAEWAEPPASARRALYRPLIGRSA